MHRPRLKIEEIAAENYRNNWRRGSFAGVDFLDCGVEDLVNLRIVEASGTTTSSELRLSTIDITNAHQSGAISS